MGRATHAKRYQLMLRDKLNEEAHRVHAAFQMGGVCRVLVSTRGNLIEKFTLAGEDVTQSITRLERAGLIDGRSLKSLPFEMDEQVRHDVMTKVLAGRKNRP